MPNCRSEQAPGSAKFSGPLDREPSQNDSRFLFMDHGNSPKGNSPKCIQPSIEEDYQDLIVLKHGPVRFSLLQDWRVLSGPLM